jgi:hypothetical protein
LDRHRDADPVVGDPLRSAVHHPGLQVRGGQQELAQVPHGQLVPQPGRKVTDEFVTQVGDQTGREICLALVGFVAQHPAQPTAHASGLIPAAQRIQAHRHP